MKKADNRAMGRGLTIRQVRDVLNSISEDRLDGAFIVEGQQGGYDFVSYAGPAEKPLKIGTPEINTTLVAKGSFIVCLQDEDIT